MESNEKLKRLADALALTETDWEEVDAQLIARPSMLFAGVRSYDFSQPTGIAAEISMHSKLKALASIPNNPYGISLCHGIQDGIEVGHLRFKTDCHRLRVYDREKNITLHEYDGITIIGGLPTVLEVKTLTKNRANLSQARKHGGSAALKYTLSPKRVMEHLEPVREYYGRDVGYLVAVRPEYLYALYYKKSYVNHFVQEGGLVVPICNDFSEFKAHVKRLCLDFVLEYQQKDSSSQQR